jgi:hypothetical protein
MKIYVTVVEAFKRNEIQGEIQFIVKIDGFLSSFHLSPYWKQLENKQEMKHSLFMKWNNCIN